MNTHRSTVRILSAVCVLHVVALAHSQDLPTYRVQVIGTELQGFAMNEQGAATGRRVDANQVGRAFVALPNQGAQILPLPAPWVSSDGYAINSQGVVVGAVSTTTIASVGSHAAAWYPSEGGYRFELLGALPGHDYSTATGVNDLGDIVGGSGGIGLGMYSAAVTYASGQVSELPGISLPADINNDRVLVADNTLLDLDTMQSVQVPLPPGNWQGMVAADISNSGGICGYIAGFSGCSTFPVRALSGQPLEIIGGCATTTSAISMNDQGDALTFVYNGGLGCVFVDAGYTNLSGLIAPSQGAWGITGLTTINNAREILAIGRQAPAYVPQLVRLVPLSPEDINQDGLVDGADLGALLAAWGSSNAAADLDHDGLVGGGDLGLLLAGWTP